MYKRSIMVIKQKEYQIKKIFKIKKWINQYKKKMKIKYIADKHQGWQF